MKTKHLFYSVAIAATLASCTQDNFEVAENKAQDLSIRPELGVIELTENAQATTRFATATGDAAQPVFTDGDMLGACIMDVPKYPTTPYDEKNPSNNYTIEEYYSSNNAFTRTNSIWKVDQPMVEGNYLFYAPYNQKMQLRTPFEILVPAIQDASTEKKALDDFYASGKVVRVGYQFLAAKNGEAQRPVVTMNDVFAYPQITIANKFNGYLKNKTGGKLTAYNGDIKVDSIRLVVVDGSRAVQEDIVIGGTLSNSEISTLMGKDGAWATSPMENYTKDLLASSGQIKNDGAKPAGRTAGYITTLIANRTIAQGTSEKFYAVMPAMATDGTNTKLQANIYVTIDGKQYVIADANLTVPPSGDPSVGSVSAGTQFKSAVGTIKLIKGQKYPQEELNFENNKLTAKSSAGSILTLELKGGRAAGDVQIADEITAAAPATTIGDNAQFINFFKDQLNGAALVESGSSIDGTNFAFSTDTKAQINAELINALFTYNNKGTLQIDKSLVIANDVKVTEIGTPAGNYTPITFKAGDSEFTISLKTTSGGYSVNANVLRSEETGAIKSVHVKSGATYSVSTNTTAGNIRNDGTITVAEDVILTPTTSFVNYGTLELTGTVANTVTNNKVISIENAKASVTVNAGNGQISLPVANKAAKVTVSGGTQEGIYEVTGAINKEIVGAADAIAWINAIRTDAAVAFNSDVLGAMKDIKKVYAIGASFVTGTFNMSGKTLVLEDNSAKTISGTGVATTIVNNLTIINAGSSDVTLNNIAASGSYSNAEGITAKILTGTNATWNGGEAK